MKKPNIQMILGFALSVVRLYIPIGNPGQGYKP